MQPNLSDRVRLAAAITLNVSMRADASTVLTVLAQRFATTDPAAFAARTDHLAGSREQLCAAAAGVLLADVATRAHTHAVRLFLQADFARNAEVRMFPEDTRVRVSDGQLLLAV